MGQIQFSLFGESVLKNYSALGLTLIGKRPFYGHFSFSHFERRSL